MTCPRCHDRSDDGPACPCGLADVTLEVRARQDDALMDAIDNMDTPHSGMSAAQAIAEARFMGEPSAGDGWRRLLWRMASLLEATNGTTEQGS